MMVSHAYLKDYVDKDWGQRPGFCHDWGTGFMFSTRNDKIL